MVFGLAVVGFAGYFALGVVGYRLDWVTEALAPPYQAPRIQAFGAPGDGGGHATAWSLVEDDLEAGLDRARSEGKRALLNFTGVTCVNCRDMEVNVFPKPEVARELAKLVEIRLHTDKVRNADVAARSVRFREYRKRLTGSQANPIYVIIDPKFPENPLAIFAGADVSGGAEFRQWIADNA
jgi:thiol:disulfide interchange protein DsbD